MSGWRQMTLGEFLSLQRGHDLPSQDRAEGDVPIMGSFGITGFHNVARARGPGVTVGRSGASIGTVSFIQRDYWPLNTCMYVTDFKGNDPRFVYHLLGTLDLARFNSGSAQPSLNRNYIYPMEIVVPPISEQREISAILSTLDDKIELNRRTAATLEDMARALYRSWFVDFDPVQAKSEGRVPAHMDPATSALFPDSFGADGLPVGWAVSRLGILCHQIKQAVKPMDTPEANFWHFSLPAFDAGRAAVFESGAEIKSNKLFVPNDAIMFSRLNPSIPRVWWARSDHAKGTPAASTEFYVAVARSTEETPWLYCLLSSPGFQEQAVSRVTGTSNSHQRVSASALSEIETIEPSPETISAFGEAAGDWFERIHALYAECRTLATLRDTLLPRLMSGELRVGKAQEQVEEAV